MIHKEQAKQHHKILDATCDICGDTCMTDFADDVKEFEGFNMITHWGFMSNKDLEKWTAQICEKCVDTHLKPLINFKITNYG